ncbi:HNH/endonuclease VII fold putative polymorphic toxin [Pseudomonas sp. R4-34-07]|uniref:HNH/endonuclease VII fold putative polymorphic toxin n=1 Tax=Pseudomonas sp. R4-34-07 TaxID=658642 RepID=UPI003558AA63
MAPIAIPNSPPPNLYYPGCLNGQRFGRADGIGDQKAHFSFRPIAKPRNGTVDGGKDHYNFRKN